MNDTLENFEEMEQAFQDGYESTVSILDALINHGVSVAELKRIPPETVETLYMRGFNLINAGKFAEARDVLLDTCRLSSNVAKYWVALGVSRQHLGEFNDAILAYCRSALIDDDPRTAMRIAECWMQLGETEECLSALQMVKDLSEDDEMGRSLTSAADEIAARLEQSSS